MTGRREEAELVLRAGRDRSVRRMHPWVLSGSVADVRGDPRPGETVRVVSAAGEVLGRGAYSPASRLRARMWTTDGDTVVDEQLIGRRIHEAARRRAGLARVSDAARLVFSEADGVPGVIADRYGDHVVVQIGSAGAEHWRESVADALLAVPGVRTVFERSDVDARNREGLAARTGLLRGDAASDEVVIHEHGVRYAVGVAAGQKTGFYLDQRPARVALRGLAAGARVLNAFSYTGAFSIVAAAAGAVEVTSLDSSAAALLGEQRNADLNGLVPGQQIEGDAFRELRTLRDRARMFDLIVLDPPRLAATQAHVERAARAYKDLNLLAIKLLSPGGTLMTFSCSGGLSEDLFQKIVAGAALDARRNVRIVDRLHQGSDHPVPLSFPEAAYLKGLVVTAD